MTTTLGLIGPGDTAAVLEGATVAPASRNPFAVYVARLGAGSRATMAEALDTIACMASGGAIEGESFPWHQLRYQHAQAIRTRLSETVSARTGRPLSPASINKHLAALRGVLRECWRLGLMSAEELARAIDLEPVRGSTPLRGRALEAHQVARLFDACMRDATAAGPRDAVILALGLAAGLRRAEIAGLSLADLDLAGETILLLGKGHRVRSVPIKSSTLEAIRAWLRWRGEEPGPLVCAVRKGGTVMRQRLAPAAVLRVCEKRGLEAGLRDFTAHDLRRTYISVLLDRGVDLATAADLAGHASPNTTKRYDRRGERARHAAAEAILVPYVGQPDMV